MTDRQIKNEKGFTLIELLIAMAIGISLLATASYTYTKQNDVIRSGNQQTKTRGMARLALDEMVQEIRRAGFGMEPGDSAAGRAAQGVTNATATSITYLANTDNIMTEVIVDCGVDDGVWFVFTTHEDAVTGTSGPFTLGFRMQDYVSVYDAGRPGKSQFFEGTGLVQVSNSYAFVSTYCPGGVTAAGLVNFGPGPGTPIDYQYEPVDDNTAVVVHKIITYTYTYNAGAQTITQTRQDGARAAVTTTIADNVTAMTFSYFDANGGALTVPLNATELGNLRQVHISVTVKDRIEDTVTVQLDTDINLRNMGL